jgi:methyl-branched lipid omega-hydroxylase
MTTLTTDEINLASFDFWLRDDVHEALAKLRRERPIAWHEHRDSGSGFWSLTRYDDIAEVSRRWELFSSTRGFFVARDVQDVTLRPLIVLDPPKHTQLRAIVNRAFSPKIVALAEKAIQKRATAIVSAIAPRGTIEFVSEVASALPAAIIGDMMGVPEEDRSRLIGLVTRHLAAADADDSGSRAAAEEIRDYGIRLARLRLEHPEEDLTTTLVSSEVDGKTLPLDEVGPFFTMLIAAGFETTRNALSHAVWLLTKFPDQKRRWLTNIDGYAATAVDEIVRWASPTLHMRRTLTRDAEFGGVQMRAGEKVAMWFVSANRDESHFSDPQVFDIGRSPNKHCGFGSGGPHFCLGAYLARRELVVLLGTLLRQLPDIHATSDPERFRSNFLNGIKTLHTSFTPFRS